MAQQPIGPYTFGEEYNQIQEKSRALELSYNKKKNEFTPDQVDRTRELAAMYPGAQSGLISSAVIKGLNNQEFEALLKLQYQAVPKSQPVFPNQTGNDVYKSAMFNSTFGKVFNAVGKQFQLPEGIKFWNKSTYQNEPVYGTFKGIFRVLALLGGGAANATIGRTERAVISRAGDVEETVGGPLEIIATKKQKQAEDLSAKGLAGDPSVTLYDVAVARDEAQKAETYAKFFPQLAGLLTVIKPGIRNITGKTSSDYYKEAGPSTAGLALQKIREGQSPGAVWKSFGEGYFPQGSVAAEAEELREAPKFRGQNITSGRYVAELAGIEQNTLLYNGVSGGIDFFKVLYTDPFLVV